MDDNDNDGTDYFETTEYESYGSRISNSFGGICWGPLLMVASVVLLVWNEGRNLHRLQDLVEARGIVIHVNDDSVIDRSNEGRLLHISGETAIASDYLYDEEFGIQDETAIRLQRTVETYQWMEEKSTRTTRTSNGGKKRTKTYEYKKQWSNSIENSNQFYNSENHQNPDNALLEDASYVAEAVTLGAYSLSDTVISTMKWYEPLTGLSVDTVQVDTDYTLQVVENQYFYFGNDPSNPQIGDTRVSFSYVPTGSTSIVAEQAGEYLTPYYTSRGGTILLVQKGYASIAEMFAKAELENAMLTWGLRAVGFLLSFVGMGVVIRPISTMVDIVPFVGDLVDMGLNCAAFLVSFTISTAVIAIAWLFYRPLLGGGLLLLIVGIVYFCVRRRKDQNGSGYPTTNYEHYQSPHYPSSYQQHQASTGGTPFAQALDSPFAQQTVGSPALDAPALRPPVLPPPNEADIPVVYKPFS